MGEHDTWFSFIPGFANLETWASHYLRRDSGVEAFATAFSLTHVAITALVTLLLILAAIRYRVRLATQSASDRLAPEGRFGVRNGFELLIEIVLSLAASVMGRKKAERYLPLFGALFFFILLNNLIGLVPGFVPATDTLKTNLGLALTVFVLTHVFGVAAHGGAYLKHFVEPVLGLPWPLMIVLVPLFFAIEMVSHIARPVSLSLRLMGNMVGDHKVLASFFILTPWLIPLPFYLLGILVCVVQTVVFTLLSAVYIDLATGAAH